MDKKMHKNNKDYGLYISKLLGSLDYALIEEVTECFRRARKRSATIFFVGNGGSAATASHFAQDLSGIGKKTGARGFKAISLTDNAPHLTATANDYGYDSIFTGQMSELFNKEDVLVAISASGNSPNVIKAAEYARQAGGATIALVGFDGGKLMDICDHVLHVRTERGEYGPVEDIHMILNHMITTNLTERVRHESE